MFQGSTVACTEVLLWEVRWFMVSALDSGASSLGSSPGRGHCIVFLGKTINFALTVPLSTLEYKLVPANLMLGGNRAMD